MVTRFVFIRMSAELLKLNRVVVCVLNREQSLERIGGALRMVSEIMQVAVNVHITPYRHTLRGLVGEPAIPILHSLAREMETLIYPPVWPMRPIMISQYESLTARQFSQNILNLPAVADRDIPQVDNEVVRLDYLLPTLD